ncbi:MAG TPA: universal stress protein [Gemmatimonadaceae bacterium]|jgi:nucleotide-binding universal stress UspA family protein|nr:universal stress protein [Gemmatimonadaceae bacterium]
MYARILVPLEHSDYDDAIMAHVCELARLCSSSVVLIHVADGWAARNQQGLALRESSEMRDDRDYIEARRNDLEAAGIAAECVLAGGDPGSEIAAAAEREGCDLVAMSTHGHKGVQDLLRGSVANEVRHRTTVPVLMVRGKPRKVKLT